MIAPRWVNGDPVQPGDYFVKPAWTGSAGQNTRIDPKTFERCLRVDPSILPEGTKARILGEWERFSK